MAASRIALYGRMGDTTSVATRKCKIPTIREAKIHVFDCWRTKAPYSLGHKSCTEVGNTQLIETACVFRIIPFLSTR
jgi:hypothetical protein